MKIISQTDKTGGRIRVVLELAPHEKLVVIDPDAHYKLGEPMHEDVFAGHILADATPTTWCSIEQKWID